MLDEYLECKMYRFPRHKRQSLSIPYWLKTSLYGLLFHPCESLYIVPLKVIFDLVLGPDLDRLDLISFQKRVVSISAEYLSDHLSPSGLH